MVTSLSVSTTHGYCVVIGNATGIWRYPNTTHTQRPSVPYPVPSQSSMPISAYREISRECATSALEAVKVTGDPNVPAGCVTFETQSWPGVGEKVAAEIQVRADPTNPDGFSWLPGELTLVAKREIRLMCQYNLFMQSTGTFYKQNDEDDDGIND